MQFLDRFSLLPPSSCVRQAERNRMALAINALQRDITIVTACRDELSEQLACTNQLREDLETKAKRLKTITGLAPLQNRSDDSCSDSSGTYRYFRFTDGAKTVGLQEWKNRQDGVKLVGKCTRHGRRHRQGLGSKLALGEQRLEFPERNAAYIRIRWIIDNEVIGENHSTWSEN